MQNFISSKGKKSGFIRLMMTALAVFGMLAIMPVTAYADDAATLANQIRTFNPGNTSRFTATVSGTTVTVEGSVTSTTNYLTLNINAGVKVIWKATFSANSQPITLNDSKGTFEVASGSITSSGLTTIFSTVYASNCTVLVSGGTVSNTNANGSAISINSAKVTVSGGTVKATGTTGTAIETLGGVSEVTLNGGIVESVNGSAILVKGTGHKIKVNGGTVRATGTGYAINSSGANTEVTINDNSVVTAIRDVVFLSGTTPTITVNGGTVSATGTATNSAIYIYTTGTGATVNVKGGSIYSNGTGLGHAICSDGSGTKVTVSGGLLRSFGTTGATIHMRCPSPVVTVKGDGVVLGTGNAISGSTNVIHMSSGSPTISNTERPVVIAWKKPTSGTPTYTEGTWTDLESSPLTSIVYWHLAVPFNYPCIYFENGSNSGLIYIEGITVKPVPKITSQPANVTVKEGENAQFSVTATGTGLTYQWQTRINTTYAWNDVVDHPGIVSGAKTNTLKLTAVVQSSDNNQFRCVVTNSTGGVTNSDFAKLTVTSLTPAEKLAALINSFNANSAGNKLTATASGSTVTVTGSISNATNQLAIEIEQTLTVLWKAYYTGVTDAMKALVSISGKGSFSVVETGTIINNDVGSGIAIQDGGPTVTINGANCTVGAIGGGGISVFGANAKIKIIDGYVQTLVGASIGVTGAGATIEISGGLVTNLAGMAIGINAANASVKISGGQVYNLGDLAAIAIAGSGSTVTVTGGFVFSTGAAITGEGNVINMANGGTPSISGTAVVCAWKKPTSGTPTYVAGTTTDLTVSPATATATWAKSGGDAGFLYKNGAFTGFAGLPGIIVNNAPAPVAPTITSAASYTCVSGTGGTFALSATGTTPITWTLSGAPAGVTVSGSTLTVNASVAPGTYNFTVKASNGTAPDASQAFTLTVTAATVAPTITSASSYTCVSGTGGTFALSATGTTPITWTLTSAPAGVTVSGSTLTVNASVAPGTYNFTVKASNGTAPDASQAFTLTVTAATVAPTITSASSYTCVSGTGGTFALSATGTTPITWTLTSAPAGVTIVSGNIMKVETSVAPGTYNFTVKASNGTAPDASQAFTLTVTAAPVAPTITSAASFTCVNGTGGSFVLTATGTTPITWTLIGIPSGVTLSNSSGIISMNVAATVPAGTYNFTVKASNGTAPDAMQAFTLKVEVDTSNDAIEVNSLKAYAQNGVLYISGLKQGDDVRIYAITGQLIYKGSFVETHGRVSLPARGIYIIQSGGKTVKIINN